MILTIDQLSNYLPQYYSLRYSENSDCIYLDFCKYYNPEGVLILKHTLPLNSLIKYGVELLNVAIHLLELEINNYIYQVHGNGD